jgi:hypothetical protein
MSRFRLTIGVLAMLAANSTLSASGFGRPTILPPKQCINGVSTQCVPQPPPVSMKPGPTIGSRPAPVVPSRPASRIVPTRSRY